MAVARINELAEVRVVVAALVDSICVEMAAEVAEVRVASVLAVEADREARVSDSDVVSDRERDADAACDVVAKVLSAWVALRAEVPNAATDAEREVSAVVESMPVTDPDSEAAALAAESAAAEAALSVACAAASDVREVEREAAEAPDVEVSVLVLVAWAVEAALTESAEVDNEEVSAAALAESADVAALTESAEADNEAVLDAREVVAALTESTAAAAVVAMLTTEAVAEASMAVVTELTEAATEASALRSNAYVRL